MANLWNLTYARWCPGCGQLDCSFCRACLTELDLQIDSNPDAALWSAAHYQSAWKEVIISWKDRGRADLVPLLVYALVKLLCAWWDSLREPVSQVMLVPAPSRPEDNRRRGGFLFFEVLTQVASEVNNKLGLDVFLTVPLLEKQSIGIWDRAFSRLQLANQKDARKRSQDAKDEIIFRAPPRGSKIVRTCVVLDDICTTGATLYRCETVLRKRGFEVLANLVLARTQR